MMVLVISRSHRGRGIYRRLTLPVLLLVAASFLGFALVVLSESGLGSSGPLVSWRTLLGVFLSLLCGTVAGLHGFLLAWSRDLSGGLCALGRPTHPYLCFLAVYAASQLLVTAASLSAGIVLEGPALPVRWWVLAVVGGLSYGTASSFWFVGNLWARSPSVNVLSYLISSVSLGWLVLLGLVGVASPGLLVPWASRWCWGRTWGLGSWSGGEGVVVLLVGCSVPLFTSGFSGIKIVRLGPGRGPGTSTIMVMDGLFSWVVFYEPLDLLLVGFRVASWGVILGCLVSCPL